MRGNHLRELLKTGQPSLGTRLQSAWPTITELVGQSGHFDYVEILAEYAPFDLFSLENLGRAVNLFPGMSGMIKVPQENRAHVAVRAINSGIANVLFADVRTAADVAECVRAVRAETPDLMGLRGVGQGRDVGIVLEVGSPAFVQSTADTVVALMIEKKQAIEDLPSLLAVPGVDMVQFGPADYAMSIGLAGQRGHPWVREAERFMIDTALRVGILPRAEIQQPSEAEPYLALGVRHFCLGIDVRTLFNWYRDRGAEMRELLV